MSFHVPGFLLFFVFVLHHFVMTELATSSIRVRIIWSGQGLTSNVIFYCQILIWITLIYILSLRRNRDNLVERSVSKFGNSSERNVKIDFK